MSHVSKRFAIACRPIRKQRACPLRGFNWNGLDCARRRRPESFRHKANRVLWYRHSPNNTNTLSSDGVFDLLEDESGLLWVATAAGICKASTHRSAYVHYEYDPLVPEGMPDTYVSSLLEDESGRVLMGTRKGVYAFDPFSETFSYVGGPRAGPRDLRDTVVRKLYKDRVEHCGSDPPKAISTRSTGRPASVQLSPPYPVRRKVTSQVYLPSSTTEEGRSGSAQGMDCIF